ncbi:MAG: hypothetical protein QW767_00085 [Thermoprotei archaeon]
MFVDEPRMQTRTKGAALGAVQVEWDEDALAYQLSAYRLMYVLKNVFSGSEWLLTGSAAISTYLKPRERRMHTGFDIALPAPIMARCLRDQDGLERDINFRLRELGYSSQLDFGGFPFEIGIVDKIRNLASGKARFVSVFKGGYMTLKNAARSCPRLSSKMALLNNANAFNSFRLTPFFVEFKPWSEDPMDTNQWLVHHSNAVELDYQNAGSTASGLPPIKLLVSSLDVLVASKLNMIYQSAVNERLVRATPLSSHHASKAGRPKVHAADVYDYCLSSRLVLPSTVRKILTKMLTEPVNAFLDTTAEALRKISATKSFEELNLLLPSSAQLDQKSWKDICEESVSHIKKVRE